MMASRGVIISAAPFDQMSDDELRRERDYWNRYVNEADNSGPAVGVARDLRTACDAMLARRAQRVMP